MDTPKRDKEKGLTIGLVAIIIVIVILALIGFFLLEPRTETIQGQAEATQIRISGKLPGRIAEYWVEEGQHVHQGDTLVRISSPDAEAKLMQASAMESVYKATNEKVDKGASGLRHVATSNSRARNSKKIFRPHGSPLPERCRFGSKTR